MFAPDYHSTTTSVRQTYSRPLGPNELAYFLPSRASGLNDIYTRVIFRAPAALVSPFRLRIVWAIVRIQHALLAARVDMPPGRYNEARFVYSPPANPQEALEEAGHSLSIHHDKTGLELDHHFLFGERLLSSSCLSRMFVVRSSDDPMSGLTEFHMAFCSLHAITDGTSANIYTILQFLGGSAEPGGNIRSDEELFHILEFEWSRRWGNASAADAFAAITPAAESRLPIPTSPFQIAAWRVDSMNLQRRAIGGHSFPRVPAQTTEQALLEIKFTPQQTLALVSKCASEGCNLGHAIFALCNMAWLQTAFSRGPEFQAKYAPPTLPTLFYTAITLRRHLAPVEPLTSPMALALGYGTVALPGFLPSGDMKKAFWLRARNAQKQMRRQIKSPMLLPRAQIMAVERGRKAKLFAKMDDEGVPVPGPASGLPPNTDNASPPPSLALMGISHLGDLGSSYQPELYPALEFVDSVGHSRKAPGGILLFTRVAAGQRFSMMLGWDRKAFPEGLVEEFWGCVLKGVEQFGLLEDMEVSARL
uniref:Alcohol acetyltransferase n=1 Tax=Mycena chlorophos TaxID=658473 RepID=A0ABQ0KX32_MYCCL|nr:predicted protein [Mycena chlorophos]